MLPESIPMKTIAPRQKQILSYLESYITEHRVAPTHKEIGQHIGIHPTVVSRHLWRMEKKGYIKTKPYTRRNITVLERRS